MTTIGHGLGFPPARIPAGSATASKVPLRGKALCRKIASDVKDEIVFSQLYPVTDKDIRPVDLGAAGDCRSPGPWQQCWTYDAEQAIAEVVERGLRDGCLVEDCDHVALLQQHGLLQNRCRFMLIAAASGWVFAVLAVGIVCLIRGT